METRRPAKRKDPPILRRGRVFSHLFLLLLAIIAGAAAAPIDTATAASWVMTYPSYGSCEGNAVAPTSDGGYLVAGLKYGWGDRPGLLMLKTDGRGTEQWTATGFGESCSGTAVSGAGPGTVAVAGSSCTAGSGDATITIAGEAKGNVLHTWTYDAGTGARAAALLQTDDGGYLLLEDSTDVAAGRTDRDIVIRRLGAGGATIWSRAYAGPLNDTPASAFGADDGGLIVAGTTISEGRTDSDILLIRLGPDGNGNDAWVFGTEDRDETAVSLLEDSDGGAIVAGTSCDKRNGADCDIYVLDIDASGSVLWENRYGGSGRDMAAAAVQAPDGSTIIAGTTDSPDFLADGRDIVVLQLDSGGTRLRNTTFGSRDYDFVTGAVPGPGGSLILTGYTAPPTGTGSRTLFLISAGDFGNAPPASLVRPASTTAPASDTITLKVVDTATGAGIAGATVYYDGKRAGTTSESDGTFTGQPGDGGSHSFRVTRTGYREKTVTIDTAAESVFTAELSPAAVHKLTGAGSPEQSLDIVFIPSATSYDCTLRQKVPADRYTGSQDVFLADVRRLVNDQVLALDRYATDPTQIPSDFRQRYNIYYYWDGSRFADAFSGCAGVLPEDFYDDAPFTDVAVILYPSYGGTDTAGTCEPVACTSSPGPGPQVYFKAPADQGMVFLHETGHAMFGLMDTYDGYTYYAENLPFPNIWGSGENCTWYAEKNGFDIALCRPISGMAEIAGTGDSSGFFRYDPDPDIMADTGSAAKFGGAATRRIRYVLEAIRGGGV